MTASIRFDQTGIPASTGPGARTDGLATGARVTVRNDSGQPCRIELLWVPPEDAGVVASIGSTSPSEWYFDPTASNHGSYLVRMIEREGTADQSIDEKVFGIRLPETQLLIPAFNEKGDPEVTLVDTVERKATAAALTHNNELRSGIAYAAWWWALRDLMVATENAGGAEFVPYALEDALLAGVPHDITADMANASGCAMSPDGVNIFVSDAISTVYHYVCATPGKPETAGTPIATYDVGLGGMADLAVSPDGTRLLTLHTGPSSNSTVRQHNLGTGWLLSTAAYSGDAWDSPFNKPTVPNGMAVSPDGTKMLISGSSPTTIFQFTLTTGWSVAAVTDDLISQASLNTPALRYADEGNLLFMVISSDIRRFRLLSPYSISGMGSVAEHINTTLNSGKYALSGARGIDISADGYRMLTTGIAPRDLRVYYISRAVPEL